MTGSRRLSAVSFTPIGLTIGEDAKKALELEKHGLGVITAAIFLAGEMAGSGVLALPNAMAGTGWAGVVLIFLFTVNACFSGTRLGLCWVMLEERFDEFKKEIRDPYPSIGEKAVGAWGRMMSTACICLTLYGAGCVFIVLIANMTGSLALAAGLEGVTNCQWMAIVAAILIPLTWMGSPKDFWPIAFGALLTTVTACALICIRAMMDYQTRVEDFDGGVANGTLTESDFAEHVVRYDPPTVGGTFKAFSTIMFAFAGASTFPTIQADMKERDKFSYSAVIACTILFLIYVPMGVCGYFSYGSGVESYIVKHISTGPIRIVIEIMLLLHLVSAFPIITNPPAQYFEQLFKIPSDFNWKRCLFRTFSVLVLLFVAETIPKFGSILDLVGASTVTLLTFVFPPYFYMRLCDKSKDNANWSNKEIPLWERIYCWLLIAIGLAGGIAATYQAVQSLFGTSMTLPCYLQSESQQLETGGGGGH